MVASYRPGQNGQTTVSRSSVGLCSSSSRLPLSNVSTNIQTYLPNYIYIWIDGVLYVWMFVWRNTSNRLQLWQFSESLVRQAAHKANSKKFVSRIFVSSIAIVSQPASHQIQAGPLEAFIQTRPSHHLFVCTSLVVFMVTSSSDIFKDMNDGDGQENLSSIAVVRSLVVHFHTDRKTKRRQKQKFTFSSYKWYGMIHPSIHLSIPSIHPTHPHALPPLPTQPK